MRSVLIVEDERIVAKDLQQTLNGMGYDAFAIASSADEALRRASERCPDIVLMDIRIKGARDGIETATILRERHDVPIIYLTAHADEATIDRARNSEPYGYLMKPVKLAELRSAIEVSIHRHEMERRLRERERWFSTTLQSIADAVVAVDSSGNINFMNGAAETLTGVVAADAVGHPWDDVRRDWGMFRSDGVTRVPSNEIPIMRALAGETVEQAEMFMRAPGESEGRWHSVNASPVRDPDGTIRGAVTVS
ncbi:MAG TPA: response regulator, partial [Kofleriaceae bacterium]|nr:response regulator [Kofleriaceae bacterium]